MRLVTFDAGGGPKIGVLGPDGMVIEPGTADPDLPSDMTDLVRAGDAAVERMAKAAADPRAHRHPLTKVRLLAPIPHPLRNVICVGKNYAAHAHEFHGSGFDATKPASAVPEFPIVFTKAPTTIIADREPIRASLDPTASTDYEGELAVVIARDCHRVAAEDAMDVVWGYTIVNDVTARTLQRRHGQWFIGKSIDSFCPMGPVLVTADEVEPAALTLETRVNGEVRQKARVADLIFDIPTLIATLSATMTLKAGDIIATGTPEGVGIGFDPPRFLTPGDRVAVEISGIGVLENPVA